MLIRIGTRRSPLALWQARHVGGKIRTYHKGVDVEYVEIVTEGDRRLDVALSKIGGKGLFLKEIETALLEQRIDVAVHSLKDVTVEVSAGLTLAAFLERGNPRDAMVSSCRRLEDLAEGAVVGTSSTRRQCIVRRLRPDLVVEGVRGNLGTRLAKLDSGVYDALLLAGAGLERLDMPDRIACELPEDVFVPAVGQGIITVQVRDPDNDVHQLVALLDHAQTRSCALAERATNRALGGGCHLPIAAHATICGQRMTIRGLVGDSETGECITAVEQGDVSDPSELGERLASRLQAAGARRLIEKALG